MNEPITLEEGWEHIQTHGISKLETFLESNGAEQNLSIRIFTNQEYTDVYTTVYNMCIQRSPSNFSSDLYNKYAQTIHNYVTTKVVPALQSRSGFEFLREMLNRWECHKLYIKWMERFFKYLDRYHVQIYNHPTLEKKGRSIFLEEAYDVVKARLVEAMLAQIQKERDNEPIDHDLIRGLTQMMSDFKDLGNIYQDDFETAFLAETNRYYCLLSAEWRNGAQNVFLPPNSVASGVAEYARRVETIIQAEERRCMFYLHPETQSKLERVIRAALLESWMTELLKAPNSSSELLRENKVEDLSRLYRLYKYNEDCLSLLADSFKKFTLEVGVAVVEERQSTAQSVSSSPQDPTHIKKVLELHEKHKDLVTQCFGQHFIFQRALKEAFEEFVNMDIGRNPPAAYVASHCDRLLRSSNDVVDESTTEEGLTRIVEIFSFLSDKDTFADIYRTQLAKRLLGKYSASEDAEKSIVAKLKTKCGAQFTAKIEGMISDVSLFAEQHRAFEEFAQRLDRSHPLHSMDFQVQVLTYGNWPTYESQEIEVPSQMSDCLTVFRDFYMETSTHRKLAWVHHLGQVTLVARLDKTYDIICNTIQASILLLFNNATSLSVEFMKNQLCLDETVLRKLLGCFYMGKVHLLAKVNGSDDVFQVEPQFSFPNRKVKIPQLATEAANTKERVEHDRTYVIEAAVVRVMKARKSLKHNQLLAEVMSQLTLFKPNPKIIKKCIEGLIEREFLERSSSDANVYEYVA